MSTTLTPEQANAAAEVLEHLTSTGDRSHTAVMTDAARMVLKAQIGRYARVANAVRLVSQILLPPLPGDEVVDGAPVFETFDDALAWYRDNADGIYEVLLQARLYEVDEDSCRVVRGLEQVMAFVHDVDRRVILADLALASARRWCDEHAQAQALLNRGGGYKVAGQPAKAVVDYREAARLFARLDDAVGSNAALSRLAVAHAAARQLDEADDILGQVLVRCGEGAVEAALAGLAYVNRSWVAAQRGQWDKAIEGGLVGLNKLQGCDADPQWLRDAHLELVNAYIGAGDIDHASQHLAALKASIVNGPENVPQRIATALVDGELLLAQAHEHDALCAFQRALALQFAGPAPYNAADALDGAGKAHSRLGELDQAVEHHAAALSLRLRAGEPFATARTRYHLARAKNASGAADEATQLREQALLDLRGIVDPAADDLRSELELLTP
ncbi:Tetratricopeptide domain protein [Catenulispora acidiphila DSM 44928]|uniref:Tetratricopeptide domain protein n=1 Tax=Catenulispora acidiphila (strain DSM 44928 / JCM 14897 / NBRC 102108 / NRRL B-24433 / ID139908) TaxID=479433 RepID=C7QEW3_CATAD|nr:hypothetical protein [Catenulispora acidiphila]ACU72883.1 Tetratricopeptide domain protein [Catenulispora acidiphila DSM 44928]